jgi:hypothetical protein
MGMLDVFFMQSARFYLTIIGIIGGGSLPDLVRPAAFVHAASQSREDGFE